MKLSRESIVLILICLTDLITTIFWVHYRQANEGNPLMNYYLGKGLPAFIFAKLILFVMPIVLLEYARRQRPRVGSLGLRVAIAAYLFAYIGGVAQLNGVTPHFGGQDAPAQSASMLGGNQ